MTGLFSRFLRPFSTSFPIYSLAESTKMSSSPSQVATLAAGCFWGVEHLYRREFGQGKGLLDAKVGYCGGSTSTPTYQSVCSGSTGRMSRPPFLSSPSTSPIIKPLLNFTDERTTKTPKPSK